MAENKNMDTNVFNGMKILVTGAAGFIGASLCKKLLQITNNSVTIIGIDNMNNYYDINLKNQRLKEIEILSSDSNKAVFIFIKADITDSASIYTIFDTYSPDIVINLAAQAGVRYSITHPNEYIKSNIIGFENILEGCRNSKRKVTHLLYASSSSVYGANKKVPYSTLDKTDQPVSLYAATKKSNELMAYSYSKLFDIPCTGLRFFTVYGPMGRPDMAYFSFANKMIMGEKIQLYNYGDMYRDFTYIDDIIDGILKILPNAPKEDDSGVHHKVYNIGNNHPQSLSEFVEILKKSLMKEGLITKNVEIELLPMQPGDVYMTYADITELEANFGFSPRINLDHGLSQFARWYKSYYQI